jgi:para-nitrobenzyl esterase
MTSPLAAGLFQKAIVQSGGGRTNLMRGRPLMGGPDSAEAIGVAFAKGAGIEASGAQALKLLRALPAEALLNHLNLATMSAGAATYVGGPVLDGKIMPAEPAKVYAEGKAARVPLMVGANSLDIGFMKGDTVDELLAQFGANAETARSVYEVKRDDDVKKVAFRMGGDQMMGEPARYVARALAWSYARVRHSIRIRHGSGALWQLTHCSGCCCGSHHARVLGGIRRQRQT